MSVSKFVFDSVDSGIIVGSEIGLGLGLWSSFAGDKLAEHVQRLCRARYFTESLELLCFAVKKVSSKPNLPLARFDSLPLTV